MSHFFALINRMKYINRWGLMKNTETENLQEHSFQTAVLAHALATIGKKEFGDSVQPERAAVMALYHDASEILTGDMPTPIKYYNDEIKESYKKIERRANDALVEKLPTYLQDDFWVLLNAENTPEWPYVKAADALSAYIKCTEELKANNYEFEGAGASIRAKLNSMELPALRVFMDEFLESYRLTLDDQAKDLL